MISLLCKWHREAERDDRRLTFGCANKEVTGDVDKCSFNAVAEMKTWLGGLRENGGEAVGQKEMGGS